jgi:hypothetical protein
VLAHVVAQVDTGAQFEVVGKLVGVGREHAVPLVVVDRLGHDHLRAGCAGCVELLNGAVVEGAVSLAELHVQNAVVRAVP